MEIEGLTTPVLRAFVKYLYVEEMEPDVVTTLSEGLIVAADMYEVLLPPPVSVCRNLLLFGGAWGRRQDEGRCCANCDVA